MDALTESWTDSGPNLFQIRTSQAPTPRRQIESAGHSMQRQRQHGEACRPQSFTLGLRSSSTTNFAMPQLRTKCGERAFSHAGPAAWNALPEDMRAVSDSVLFRKRLKTHLFSLAFNIILLITAYC